MSIRIGIWFQTRMTIWAVCETRAIEIDKPKWPEKSRKPRWNKIWSKRIKDSLGLWNEHENCQKFNLSLLFSLFSLCVILFFSFSLCLTTMHASWTRRDSWEGRYNYRKRVRDFPFLYSQFNVEELTILTCKLKKKR